MTETINIPRESTMKEIRDAINLIAVSLAGQSSDISSWKGVQQIVRQGMAPKIFPVGSQLRVAHEVYGECIMDVATHNYDRDPKRRFEHSMTLLSHDTIIDSIQYDNREALYYCETELPAGTYHFTLLPGYDADYGGGKTLQFTLTKNVPAGGVIMFPWESQKQATETKISTYENRQSTVAIETVDVTEGTEGTDLGTADGTTTNMNHTQRLKHGSNNWKESALRQMLNSDKAAGTFWTPQTKFDRPPVWEKNVAGFMAGLPGDFLEVVGVCNHRTVANGIYEVEDELSVPYETQDRFWIPSCSEVFGLANGEVADGTQYPYFTDAAEVDWIKYRNDGIAASWWLRYASPTWAHYVRCGSSTGSKNGSNVARVNASVVVACAIY